MKKLLTLFLTLTIVLTSFAFVGTTVSADDVVDVYSGRYSVASANNSTETEISGRKCLEITGGATKFFNAHIDLVDSGFYVMEFSAKWGSEINKLRVSPDNSGSTDIVFANYSDVIKTDDWNDIRVEFVNKASTKGKAYINGEFVQEFTLGAKAMSSYVAFKFYDKSSDQSGSVFIDLESVRAIKPTSLFSFDSTTDDDVAMNDILQAIHTSYPDSKEEKVNGIYGRLSGDTSWYIERETMCYLLMTPEYESISIALGNSLIDGYDLILDTSLLFTDDTTGLAFRFDNKTPNFLELEPGIFTPNSWNKLKIVINFANGEKGTADIYVDGELKATKELNNTVGTASAIRMRLEQTEGTSHKAYINYCYISQVPTGTVYGYEEKGLTASTEGYDVDFENNVIYTTNTVTDLTVDTLKAGLGVDDSVAVRAYSDAKCENQVTGNLAVDNVIAVVTDTGIYQLFTLKQKVLKVLDVDASGKATFNPTGSVNATLIVAAYNDDGTLEKVNVKSVSGADTLKSEVSGAYEYKAFVFDSLTSVKPLVESVSSR